MVLCDRPYRSIAIVAAMREKDKVFASFSCDHTYFWSAVIYGVVPTVHKGVGEMDRSPWHSEGRSLREELCDIPRGARAADKARVKAHLGLPDPSALKAAKAKGMGIDELADFIRTKDLRTVKDILACAEATRLESPALYEAALRFGRLKLDELVSMVWAMHGDPADVEIDRVAKLQDCAGSAACVCGGKWHAAAERLCCIQGLDSMKFRACIVRALKWGRRKSINVLIVGEPDGGKSFLLKPLGAIYVSMIRRGQNETFALQGIHGKEIALLQDVRYETFGLPWDDWLAWGEGEKLTVRLPRSHFAESKMYEGTAPIFASMADPFSYPVHEARKFGRNIAKENRQFESRWAIIPFKQPIPECERDVTLEACPRCAASWYAEAVPLVMSEERPARVKADSLRLDAQDGNQVAPPPFAAQALGAMDRRVPSGAVAAGAAAATGSSRQFFSELQQLMAWQADGRLTADEFQQAKRKLLA